jgi:hypothetical protein
MVRFGAKKVGESLPFFMLQNFWELNIPNLISNFHNLFNSYNVKTPNE